MVDLTKLIEAVSLLQTLTGGAVKPTETLTHSAFIGKKCIVRTYSEGVIFGEIVEAKPDFVRIKNARKLWRWQAKKGVSLESVSVYGIDQSKSRIPVAVQLKEIYERYSITSCTQEAINSIEQAPEAEQS